MMLLWMLSAVLFTLFMAIAAYWAERLLRAAGRPGRGAWLFALAAGTIWPVLVPLMHLVWPPVAPAASSDGATMVLGAIRVLPDRLGAGGSWLSVADRALAILWFGLSAMLVLRYAVLWLAVRRLRRRAERTTIDGVDVFVSGELGPAVIGLRDAAVLMPRAMLELDAPLRRLVLRHEEEHRRAHDTWVLFGLALAVAAMPWNLPLWFIARRARLALEVDCDARVMAAGESVTRYVQVLLLAAQRVGAAPLTPMLVASRTHLERRIHAMHDISLRRHPLRIAGAAAACIIAGAAACSSHIADGVTAPKTTPTPVNAPQPYREFQLERSAQLVPATMHFVYPPELKAARIEGQVVAQFVVEPSGLIDTSTFKVLRSSDAAFTRAVKDALPNMRFTPAAVGGRAVRQMLQQPFSFSLPTDK